MMHVHPINDLKEHLLDGTTCECHPHIETEGELMVVHNSFDGREAVERANAILGSPKGVEGKKWRGDYE